MIPTPPKAIRRSLLLFGVLFGFHQTAYAQNFNTVPLGGRTATMGGAATAAGNDSAMPYLNPSGLAGVPGDIFAISATVYGIRYADYGGIFLPRGTPAELGTLAVDQNQATSRTLFELPSSVMYFKHLSPPEASTQHRVGVALVIPQSMSRGLVTSFRGQFTGTAAGNIGVQDSLTETSTSSLYYFGPSYAVGFKDRLRLGVSLFAVYLQNNSTRSASTQMASPGTPIQQSTDSGVDSFAVGVVPIIGAQFQLLPRFWLGLGAAPPALPLGGHSRQLNRGSMTLPGPNGSGVVRADESLIEGSLQVQTPWRLNFGVAYQDREHFSLSADTSVYGSTPKFTHFEYTKTQSQSQSGEIPRTARSSGSIDQRGISLVNFGVGGEAVLSRLLALRAGAFTDFSPFEKVGTTSDYAYYQRVTRYGGTIGLGIHMGSFDTTLGGVVTYGEGQFGAIDPTYTYNNGTPVVPINFHEWTGMLVLSGAVTQDKAKATIKKVLGIEYLPDLGTPLGSAPKYTAPPWGPSDLQDPTYTRGASRTGPAPAGTRSTNSMPTSQHPPVTPSIPTPAPAAAPTTPPGQTDHPAPEEAEREVSAPEKAVP